jgi:hypothetical protein
MILVWLGFERGRNAARAARKLTMSRASTVELLATDKGFFVAAKDAFSRPCQAVKRSSSLKKNIACPLESPHISCEGCKPPHTFGRSGCPKILQPLCSSSWTQRTPAGLPFGMPGIGELIEGAMQQAPQPGRQLIGSVGDVMRCVSILLPA